MSNHPHITVEFDGDFYKAKIVWHWGGEFAAVTDFYKKDAISRAAYILEKCFAVDENDIKIEEV